MRTTFKIASIATIMGFLIGGCTTLSPQGVNKPNTTRLFETVVGRKEYKTSAVKVGDRKRVTVGAIIGRDQVLTIARNDEDAKFVDTYSHFEGRTCMSKVDYKVVKQDPKLNISLLQTDKDLAGRRDLLPIGDAQEGPCTVISLYDARVPETNSRAKLYNFHQMPLYPYERKGKIYAKDKVTCDLGGLVNFDHPKEIVTRDALGRVNKRAPLKSDNPDFWDYYDDSGSLVIQNGELVGLITNSVTVVYSKDGKTKQRLDGEMITGQEIQKFLGRNKTSRVINKSSKEAKNDIREVYVKIVADEEARGLAWEKFVTKYVEKASKSFEKQFGIKLIITEIGEWDSDDYTKQIGKTLYELKQEVTLGKNDIVIGFTGQTYPARQEGRLINVLGRAEGIGYGNYVIVTSEAFPQDVIHEIGHIFGAEHDDHPFSVMNEESGFTTKKFYGENKKTILENRYKDFHKQEPGAQVRRYLQRRKR